jgi:hypothetical protein
MNKKIVLINGSGGVGKDTFIEFCSQYVRTLNISTVDKVKEAAKLLGWNGGKTEKDRLFLSNLKLTAVDYNDHSYNYIKKSIEDFMNPTRHSHLLFIHVREPGEIERFVKDFGCLTVLVRNNNVAGISSNMADSNVENYKYNYIINNHYSLDILDESARGFVFDIFSNRSRKKLFL